MQITKNWNNQVEVILKNGDKIFFSYHTPVAAWVQGEYYKTDIRWSATTSMHINRWRPDADWVEKPQEFFYNLVKDI